MKVKELIQQLEKLDLEAEIMISVRKGWRPIGDMKRVDDIQSITDQDTAKVCYAIFVDIKQD